MSQPTPGPVKVDPLDPLCVVPADHGTVQADGRTYLPVVICRVGVGANRPLSEAQANARRIVELWNMRCEVDELATLLAAKREQGKEGAA